MYINVFKTILQLNVFQGTAETDYIFEKVNCKNSHSMYAEQHALFKKISNVTIGTFGVTNPVTLQQQKF